MTLTPRADLVPNTLDYETEPLVTANGFREYDARWLFGTEINLIGVQALGLGLGTLIHEMGVSPRIVTGHDFRAYSLSIKQALMLGLMEAGCEVLDIGLAVSPMAYFAQFDLDAPAVAMVTASHNENGWTGVKMGANRPLTFGPEEMTRLKAIVLGGRGVARAGGSLQRIAGVRERYLAEVTKDTKIARRLRVVAACGNGTAGAFAPQALRAMGAEVTELDCDLDFTFPRYNPNPEDLKMLHALADAVKEEGADLGLAFDGDGDRCGVVTETGEEIFADKVGVLIARDLAARHTGAKFVVDVKSTGLYLTDPELKRLGAQTVYWKTGHSYIKRHTTEIGAIAGFEKSGHYFFRPPLGRGYDDGLVAAAAILRMLDANPDKSIGDLAASLQRTWATPTMGPYCADDRKYAVVDAIVADYQQARAGGVKIAGRTIAELVTVNGVRVILDDGTWGLVRASSNKPQLVIVCESPVSEAQMRAVFADIEARLARFPEVGEFDQKI